MKYILFIKPGIIFGNIITLSAGYFIGIKNTDFDTLNFLTLLFGMILIIATGCILNNYIDRDIDYLMERTKYRFSVFGLVSLQFALSYAFILGFIGFFLLFIGTNTITILIALIGLIFYVIFYTLWFKRTTIFGTFIGGISGALPPVIGYSASTACLNYISGILFLILFCWQIPHFFSISIYWIKDYKIANIPILPLKIGIFHTKINILIFIILYIILNIVLNILIINNIIYLILIFILGLIWILLTLQGFIITDIKKWARKMFLFSIINITFLSFFIFLFSFK